MKRVATVLSILLFSLGVSLYSQETLTNDSVVKLVKAGLSEDLIVNMVNSQAGKYSLGAGDVIALKNQGISEKIIAAMIRKNAPAPTPKLPDDPTAAGTSSNAGPGSSMKSACITRKAGSGRKYYPRL